MVRRFQFAALTASLLLAMQAWPAAAAQNVGSRIAVGGSHTCALTGAGGVKCWGFNPEGQLGDGTRTDRLTPVDVVGLRSGVIAITAGRSHTCAVTSGGGVKCWGFNHRGQLGDGTLLINRLTPVDVVGLNSGVTTVRAGGVHTCALTAAGGVKCWGFNTSGQLGDGTRTQRRTPVGVDGLSRRVTNIAVGDAHTCAVTAAGGLKCWGLNDIGQIGDGTLSERLTPVDVVGLSSGVTAAAAGNHHTCALTAAGGVKCWGVNGSGQLGDGTTTVERFIPADVVGLNSGVTAVSAGAGGNHTCALTAAGGIKCWGDNTFGQLGDGTRTDGRIPGRVSGLSRGVTAVAAGSSHTCALTAAGSAKCWGASGLGNGTTTGRRTPVTVLQFHAGGRALIATGSGHTCGVTSGGGAKCWGHNQFGQLGDGTYTTRLTPVDVSGLGSGVIAAAAGSGHSCGIISNGGVKCWGRNVYGQLGDGTNSTRLTPVDVTGLGSGVDAVVAGHDHACALTAAGGVACWGHNQFGQLGDGTNMTRLTPIDVSGLSSGANALAVGRSHTCGATSGGVKCWGNNENGQLGDGTKGSSRAHATPTDVVGLSSGIAGIVAGAAHTCALTNAGGVKCWGKNNAGQLGDGTTTERLIPVDVAGFSSGAVAIAAGDSHTCALTAVGGIKCWGLNTYGQLGDGTTTPRRTPVDVSGLGGGVAAIAAGYSHTCAITDTGKAKCWGDNTFGQLGSGTRRFRLTPVNVSGF